MRESGAQSCADGAGVAIFAATGDLSWFSNNDGGSRSVGREVSLSEGNSSLPFADSFVGDEQPFGQLALGEALFLSQPGKKAAKGFFVQFVHIQSPRGVLLAPV